MEEGMEGLQTNESGSRATPEEAAGAWEGELNLFFFKFFLILALFFFKFFLILAELCKVQKSLFQVQFKVFSEVNSSSVQWAKTDL